MILPSDDVEDEAAAEHLMLFAGFEATGSFVLVHVEDDRKDTSLVFKVAVGF